MNAMILRLLTILRRANHRNESRAEGTRRFQKFIAETDASRRPSDQEKKRDAPNLDV